MRCLRLGCGGWSKQRAEAAARWHAVCSSKERARRSGWRPEEVPMNETKRRRTPTETEQRLRRGVGEEIVTLEDGDPLEEAEAEAAGWDWDSDGVSGELHCASCGAWGPVFRLEDG